MAEKLKDTLSLNDLIKAAIEQVKNRFENEERSEVEQESLRSLVIGKLPEDCTYDVQDLCGTEAKFRASISTNDLAAKGLENWIADF